MVAMVSVQDHLTKLILMLCLIIRNIHPARNIDVIYNVNVNVGRMHTWEGELNLSFCY